MAVGDVSFDNAGNSVEVSLTSTVGKDVLAYVDGWLGITNGSGDSGDETTLSVDDRAYQIILPSGFAGERGDKVYIDVTDLTGHIPDSTAYSKTAGANKVLLGKLTTDQDTNDMAVVNMVGKAQVES